MSTTLDQIGYASLPAAALAVLADLRCLADVHVALVGDRAWVRWEPANDLVLSRLLPIRGIELYACRDGLWYKHGQHLPSFDLPIDMPGQPLARVLLPAPVEPIAPPNLPILPLKARLMREDRPRQTTAMLCSLSELCSWADSATTAHLTSIQAARYDDHVLLVSRRVPPVPGSARFWGGKILIPLGFRLEPALPEQELLAAWGLDEEEFVLWRGDTVAVIAQAVLEPLTRAGIRMALREHAVHE